MRFAEVLKKNGVEVVITDDAERELKRFRECHVSHAVSADGRTGVIFLSGFDERNKSGLADHHVIVLREGDVREDIITAYRHAKRVQDVVFATSSPSKTADIEGKLVFGMHGPRKLTVILEARR